MTTQLTAKAMKDLAPLPSSTLTRFAENPFAQHLADIARVIAAREELNSQRQVFFVNFDGWDHHDKLLANQSVLLPMLSQGLRSFRDALVDIGAFDDVATFTVSEFGRSLRPNSRQGADHGWGGHQIVIGGSVAGGRVFGKYPDISANSKLHVGDGVIAPTLPNDLYFAELATWAGVSEKDLNYVFPRLRDFRSHAESIGFLG